MRDWTSPLMVNASGRVERLDAIPHMHRHKWKPLKTGLWSGSLTPAVHRFEIART